MRIGLIAPPWESVPPTSYGGTEAVVDNLARGLAGLGHDVRLFTVGESTCPVSRAFLFPAPVDPMGTSVEEAAHVLAAYDAFGAVDVVHDHTGLGGLLAGAGRPQHPPVVVTHHGPFSAPNRRILAAVARHAAVVAISHDQARRAGDVPISAVIHHGIDLDAYPVGPGDGDYVLFVGRMSPDKGVAAAVRVARAAGRRLVVVTKMREPGERAYFEQVVAPLLTDAVTVLVEPPPATRGQLWRGAVALLNPIGWPEPFGLVMAESLASGTPVLTFGSGAAPEIVEHGRTGFVCRDEADLIAALGRVHTVARADCRAAAEQRFAAARMASDYARLYRRVVDGALPARHRTPRPRATLTLAPDPIRHPAEVAHGRALDVLGGAAD